MPKKPPHAFIGCMTPMREGPRLVRVWLPRLAKDCGHAKCWRIATVKFYAVKAGES